MTGSCTQGYAVDQNGILVKMTNCMSKSFLYLGFATDLSSLIINATSLKVGYLWDNPRKENILTTEVVMDKEHISSTLRLICEVSPALPTDEDHWDNRNEIVKWRKVGPKAESVNSIHYWSSDMTKTAISFSNVTLDILGSYSCTYGDLSSVIDILGEEKK